MARQKTSKALVLSMRLNPAMSDLDAQTLDILQHYKQQGYSFKQVAQDAILRASGYTPEMFNLDSSQYTQMLQAIQAMLTDFAEQILARVPQGERRALDSGAEDAEGLSGFALSFARSFMQRQAQGGEAD